MPYRLRHRRSSVRYLPGARPSKPTPHPPAAEPEFIEKSWTTAAPAAATYTPDPVVEDTLDYDSMLKADLVALADERGVDSSGTKAEIAERLNG